MTWSEFWRMMSGYFLLNTEIERKNCGMSLNKKNVFVFVKHLLCTVCGWHCEMTKAQYFPLGPCYFGGRATWKRKNMIQASTSGPTKANSSQAVQKPWDKMRFVRLSVPPAQSVSEPSAASSYDHLPWPPDQALLPRVASRVRSRLFTTCSISG